MAAKRSREAHKRNIEALERTARQLEEENHYYATQNRLLRAQVEHYQELLARPPMSVSRLKDEIENIRWNPEKKQTSTTFFAITWVKRCPVFLAIFFITTSSLSINSGRRILSPPCPDLEVLLRNGAVESWFVFPSHFPDWKDEIYFVLCVSPVIWAETL